LILVFAPKWAQPHDAAQVENKVKFGVFAPQWHCDEPHIFGIVRLEFILIWKVWPRS